MKKTLLFLISSLLMIACNTATNVATGKSNKKKVVATKPFLPQNFSVDIDFIQPLRFTPRNVSGFSMDVKGDSVFLYLPYEGELHTASLGGNSLDFDNKASEMKRVMDKKGAEIVTFKMHRDAFFYEFRIVAFDNNNIDIQMQPSNGDACSYSGRWREFDEKK